MNHFTPSKPLASADAKRDAALIVAVVVMALAFAIAGVVVL